MSSVREILAADLREALETQKRLDQQLAQKPDGGLGRDSGKTTLSTGNVSGQYFGDSRSRVCPATHNRKTSAPHIDQFN